MTTDAGAVIARAYRARGEGHVDEALRLYEEAVAMLRGHGDPLALAHAVRHVGDIHQDAGRMVQAERCYVEALEIYRGAQGTPPLDLANAVRPLALVKEAAGELDAARALWREARDLYTAAGVRAGVAESARRLERLEHGIA